MIDLYMEKLLAGLFDYQRFDPDPVLQSIIDETESRCYKRKLSDAELGMLSAAGDPFLQTRDPQGREEP